MEDLDEEFYSHPLLELRGTQETLTSDRLELRPLKFDDAVTMSELANNIKIASMLANLRHPYSLRDAHTFIGMIERGEHQAMVYAICIKETEELIGLCELNYAKPDVTAIGYWIGEPSWNKDYCTEAVRTLIDHCFSESLVNQILANCRVINGASRRVLEKCCFRYLGDGLEYSSPGHGSQTVERYALDRKTWASLKQWK